MKKLSYGLRGLIAALLGVALLAGFTPVARAQGITNTGALSLDTSAGDPAAFLAFTDTSSITCLVWNRYFNGGWSWPLEPAPGPTACGSSGFISTGVFATTYNLGSARHYVAFTFAPLGLTEYDDGFTKPSFYTSQYLFGGPAGAYAVGATTAYISGTRASEPFAFVHNGVALWSSSWNGSAFVWTNHGAPAGVSISQAVGTLAVAAGSNWNPYAFVIGTDGNLWSRWWNGSVWTWTNHSKPSGVSLSTAVGATVIASGTRPFVYIVGSDGNLWSRNWTNSAWGWTNHGKPSGITLSSSMGSTCGNNCGSPFAFLLGSDGNLWSNDWSGSAWRWTNHSKPAGITLGASIGATAVSFSRPYVFIMGSDGHVWLRQWDGSAWSWVNQGI